MAQEDRAAAPSRENVEEDLIPATFGWRRTAEEAEAWARELENEAARGGRGEESAKRTVEQPAARAVLDVTGLLNDSAAAIVDDSFSRCFTNRPMQPWNWNVYLFPLWLIGLAVRFLVLFPLRAALLAGGFLIFTVSFSLVRCLVPNGPTKKNAEAHLVQFLAASFVASWTGVVRYHGPTPSPRGDQVLVSNHTSMIDFAILAQRVPCAVIMQSHGGWVGMLQRHVLSALGCIEFNRKDRKDKKKVADQLRKHVATPGNNPPLIFPEGTCVNNEFCVMFKKGAFELGCPVVPVAIKYNKTFVDAFWNSRKQSFTTHLLTLMLSWAVVCDVHFMEPQAKHEGEKSEDFADRVRSMIAERAGLKKVRWDGMYKYYQPSPSMCEKQRRVIAERLLQVIARNESDH